MSNPIFPGLPVILQRAGSASPDERDAYWTWVFRAVRYPSPERVVDKVRRNINFVVGTERWASPRIVY